MDGEDFAMPSPKRQRTNSPEPTHPATNPDLTAVHTKENVPSDKRQTGDQGADIPAENTVTSSNEMLDALMQHVESETAPYNPPQEVRSEKAVLDSAEVSKPTLEPTSQDNMNNGGSETLDATRTSPHQIAGTTSEMEVDAHTEAVAKSKADEIADIHKNVEITAIANTDTSLDRSSPADAVSHTAPAPESQAALLIEPPTTQESGIRNVEAVLPTEAERAALQVDGIPATVTAEGADGEGGGEWEMDSSPYNSSTDSDSTDSSDNDSDEDDEDADGDYAMLDPEEAARILMHGDAGSDDEGDRSRNKSESSALRTANEQMEDVHPIPDVTITDDMKIEELGFVEAIVEKNVLIRGKVSGEYQVLESGSLLCLGNRSIAGVVAETLGRVEEPLYTVRFRTEQDIQDRGLSEKGTMVHYVPQHSTFVFTQPLKAFKGSDASNFHDEEVGDEEMEFSDDEAEAEHKRQMKLKRQGRSGETGRGRGSARGRGRERGGFKPSPLATEMNGAAYGNGSLEMNYDDVEEGEEGYTPLARPTNLHEMMNSSSQSEPSNASHAPPPQFSDRGRGRGNRDGGRGYDRGGRGGRGNHRGNYNNHNNNRSSGYHQNNRAQNQYANVFPNPFAQSQPPAAPLLTPFSPTYPYSAVTSPMSPLPNSQSNFGNPYQTGPHNHGPSFQQQQQQRTPQMPAGFAPQFNHPAMLQFAQQFHQNQQQQNHQHPNNGWQVNQAAAAEVQRQLEEMRRTHEGNQ